MFTRFIALIITIYALCNVFVAAADCEGLTSQSSCVSSKCSWCTSGAVGASCMNPADAAGLPSSVFTCTSKVSSGAYHFLSTSACEGVTSESACNNSAADCSWCTSGAVGASCMSSADAAGLPSSVFTCGANKKIASGASNAEPVYNRPWMSDVEYNRKHADYMQAHNLGATLKTSAAAYPSDPFGYATLYFSEYAYCLNYMSANYNSNKYTAGFVPTLSFSSGKSDSIVGFVGYQPSTNAIIVSFRGSENIQNWITNLSFIRTDYPNCSGCSVHKGFYQAEQEVLPQIQAEVAKLNAAHPSYSVVVTGHSLGAALATLTALDLAPTYGANRVKLYNYGCPRMFNQAGADFASGGAITIGARRTHYKDIVPHTPPEIMGFVHTSGEIYENGPSSNYPGFPGGPLKGCLGEEDSSCADQYDGTSTADHLLYSGLAMGTGGCAALK